MQIEQRIKILNDSYKKIESKVLSSAFDSIESAKMMLDDVKVQYTAGDVINLAKHLDRQIVELKSKKRHYGLFW